MCVRVRVRVRVRVSVRVCVRSNMSSVSVLDGEVTQPSVICHCVFRGGEDEEGLGGGDPCPAPRQPGDVGWS